jgi:triosephosphate isomerase
MKPGSPHRRPLVVANWKMNFTPGEASDFAGRLLALLAKRGPGWIEALDLAIAPAHPALDRLRGALSGSDVQLAAQNLHPAAQGAYTGEVSLAMLEDLGCRFVLIGHSERRHLFGEDDEFIAAKASRLVGSSVRPILCVGETLEEREAGETLDRVTRQLAAVLDATGDGLASQLVVAYEPVWAIGTGRTATPDDAQAVHAEIRKNLIEHFGESGRQTRILYGGSVKPSNVRELLAQPDLDGALVGGARLDPEAFASIALASLEKS